MTVSTYKMRTITLIHCIRKRMGEKHIRCTKFLKLFGTFVSSKENHVPMYHSAKA